MIPRNRTLSSRPNVGTSAIANRRRQDSRLTR
jgi:hypothetical protein